MFWNEIPENERESFAVFIDERFKQLHGLYQGWLDKIFQFLMITNAGSAVAVLAFLGSTPKARGLVQAWAALALLFLGVVLTGINTAIMFYQCQNLTTGWFRDVRAFYNGEMEWDTISDLDDKRSEPTKWAYIVGWASFGCFIGGAILGLWCLAAANEP